MLRIGHFAHLTQVPVRTLHYYDEIGLLKPDRVDPESGYRYYSFRQLATLNRILSLKDLGLSLDQIALMIGEVSANEVKDMLLLRLRQLEEQKASVEAELARVAARLKLLEREDSMSNMTYEVALKTTEPVLVASMRIVIPTNDRVPAFLDPAFQKVKEHVQAQGAAVLGPCLARWHTAPDVYQNEDVEAIFPISRSVPDGREVKVYHLPVEEVAAVVHHGKFEGFAGLHRALMEWTEANGYYLAGAYREIYHEFNPAGISTIEIQWPVAVRPT